MNACWGRLKLPGAWQAGLEPRDSGTAKQGAGQSKEHRLGRRLVGGGVEAPL